MRRALLLIGVLAMILIAVRPEVTLFLLLSSYVVLGCLWNLACLLRIFPVSSSGLPTAHGYKDQG